MKTLIFTYLLVILSINAKSQSFDCGKIHVGKFELDSEETGITSILRTDKQQYETNKKYDVKVQYDIVWVDNCTYQLKNRKLISGKLSEGDPTDIILVKVLKIENNIMFVQCSSNYSDFISESEIKILNNEG